MASINEKMERVTMGQPVTCTKCGHVGEAFLPVDKDPEIKAWGEELVALSAAVTLDEVLDELSKPSAIDGCEKGLALARDRIRCMRHPAQGVPDTAAPVPPKPEGGR